MSHKDGPTFVPGINGHFRKMFSGPTRPTLNASMIVWTKQAAGVYYCPGSTFYKSGSGRYMEQGDVLTAGSHNC